MTFGSLLLLLLFGFFVAQAQAQTLSVGSASMLPSQLAANFNYRLLTTISLSGAGNYAGTANATITCTVLPCFNVSLATSGNVRFANVTFDFPSGPGHVFLVHNVGHLELSDVTFRDAQTNSIELVRWQAAGGNLTIVALALPLRPPASALCLGPCHRLKLTRWSSRIRTVLAASTVSLCRLAMSARRRVSLSTMFTGVKVGPDS